MRQAHQLFGASNFIQAEALYRQVLQQDPANVDALQSLVAICLQSNTRLQAAEQFLAQLVEASPSEPGYLLHHANILVRLGRLDDAIGRYQQFVERQPGQAVTHYNFALLLKQAGQLEDAIAQYQTALELGIDQPEQVHTNLSVIYSAQQRHAEARTALEMALATKPGYVPALYNLGLMEEEFSHWDQARALFRQILEIDPGYSDAMVRLANNQLITDPRDPLVDLMKKALVSKTTSHDQREALNFALGKVHDDTGDYAKAFTYYQQANFAGSTRAGEYFAGKHEALINALLAAFPLQLPMAANTDRPVFICGMFRSGSTLLAQMLGAHPDLTSAGEVEFFSRQVPLTNLPTLPETIDEPLLANLTSRYRRHLQQQFPNATRIIDKRPDNFLYIGLIMAMYPNALIINTCRQPLDNCLSVYAQPLAGHMAYATDLLATGHYYVQYQRLMNHWRQCWPDNIIDVDYDQLVQNPSTVLAPLADFLNLDDYKPCLDFHKTHNRVRTASVWQVRQPLHQSSSGRWRHYAEQLQPLADYLDQQGIASRA